MLAPLQISNKSNQTGRNCFQNRNFRIFKIKYGQNETITSWDGILYSPRFWEGKFEQNDVKANYYGDF